MLVRLCQTFPPRDHFPFFHIFLLLFCYYSCVCFLLLLHPRCSHARGILCGIHTSCMGSAFAASHTTRCLVFRGEIAYRTCASLCFSVVSVDPPAYIEGVRINSPHYLCKLVLEAGTHHFTLVVSQYEKQHTITYSLRVYATCPFNLNKIKDICKKKHEVTLSYFVAISYYGL